MTKKMNSYTFARWSIRIPIRTDEMTVTQVTEEWRDPDYPKPEKWDNKHWWTCIHRDKGVELIREAEQVAIFDFPQTNHIHISVRVEDWFQCRIISSAEWHKLTELGLIEFVSNEINNLKQLMHRPQ